MWSDFFSFAVDNLKHKGLRSWLTMIGIFIGIAAVVSLISLGEGLRNAIDIQFEKLGADKVFIQPQGGFGTAVPSYMYKADTEVVLRTSGVLDAVGLVFSSEKLKWKDVTYYGYAYAVPMDEGYALFQEVFNYAITDGRQLRKGDVYKATIGYELAQDAFNPPLKPGMKVMVHGYEFDVVGVYEKVGDPTNDYSVYIPEPVFREIYDVPERVDTIVAKVDKSENISVVAERVSKKLRQHRGLAEGKEDFSVQTPDDLIESFNNILNIIIAVLVGIAAISLIVGGIGIMNTMYTAVLERTGEIGIMKSIGARNSHIFIIFLIESGLLGFMGGAIGVLIGMGVSKLVELAVLLYLGPNFLVIHFDAWLVVGAMAFSFLVGSISGVTPAYQASKMQPVDALRYK